MADRYPGYDVLQKRDGLSWNDKTREVIDDRLRLNSFDRTNLNERQFETLKAVCDRIVPRNATKARPVPLAAFIDSKLVPGASVGYRDSRMPPMSEAWIRGLDALDNEAQVRSSCPFTDLAFQSQDQILTDISSGAVQSSLWNNVPPALFFTKRLLPDILSAYYAFPESWNEIGFGGPASPRGYVRMGFDRRDPWEASETRNGEEIKARRENTNVR